VRLSKQPKYLLSKILIFRESIAQLVKARALADWGSAELISQFQAGSIPARPTMKEYTKIHETICEACRRNLSRAAQRDREPLCYSCRRTIEEVKIYEAMLNCGVRTGTRVRLEVIIEKI
jgi:hypothetical protein